VYVGDVYIPAITELSLDTQQQLVKQFKALGLDHAVSISFKPPDIRKATLHASLYAESPKSASDFAEDVLALLRPAGYNYISFGGRRGLLEVESIDTPMPADSQLLREPTIYGSFMPDAHYLRRISSSPAILTNDFSLTLASAGVDSIIWLPSGASVVAGGDGTTYARTTKDGSITGVLAESTKYVDFEGCNEHGVGECVVWDEVDDATEANWLKVFNADHDFTGDCVIENGLIRARLREGADEESTLSVYRSSAWHELGNLKGSSGASAYPYFKLLHIDTLNPDKVVVDGQFHDGTTYKDVQIALQRGSYMLSVKAVAPLDVWLDAITGRRWGYVEGDSVLDAWEVASSDWSGGSNGDNYIVLFPKSPSDLVVFGSTEDTLQAYANAGTDLITAMAATLEAGKSAFVGAVPFPSVNMQLECEDMTTSGTWTNESDAGASNGHYLKSTTDACTIRDDRTWGTDIPVGHYLSAIRARVNEAGDTDKLRLTVFNTTDSRYMLESGNYETFTPTTDWAWYVSGPFEVQAADDGDSGWLRYDIPGATEDYHVDEMLLIPVSNSNYFPQDLTHQALVNQHLKRQVSQR